MRPSLISVPLVLFLTSCGTVSTVRAPLQVTPMTSFVFVDQRPHERRQTIHPEEQGDKLYFGDDAITPATSDLFKTLLEQRAGSLLSGKTVTLSDLTVTVEDPEVSVDHDRVVNASLSVPGGPVLAPFAGALIYGIERARSEKWVSVGIEGSVDGVNFQASKADSYRGRVSEENILTTLLAVLEMAADEAMKAADRSSQELGKPGDIDVRTDPVHVEIEGSTTH